MDDTEHGHVAIGPGVGVVTNRNTVTTYPAPGVPSFDLDFDHVTRDASTLREGDVQVFTEVVLAVNLLNEMIMLFQ